MDHFRLSAKKGDQLVLEVMAQRTGSPLDSSLAILDKTGKELARSEDVRGFDSVLEFMVPEDGEYVAQLRDFQYRGGSAFKYRLFAGVVPFVNYVFPFGGQRGKAVEISIEGRNLNGATKMTLNIDPKSPLGRQEIRLNTPRGLSNPIQFDVQELAEILEVEPNNVATNATPLAVPGIANGVLAAPDDVDRFRIKVGSDQKLLCSVEARRYGSGLDPLVAIYSGDSLVAQNDDADGSDARVQFDAKKDVEYTILLRDLTDRGGDHFGYRLSVRAPSAAAPSLAAKFFPDAVRLHRDGRTHVRCEVTRAGFDGPVRITAVHLPPGVSAEPLVIPQGRNEGDLLLTATPEAVMGTVPMAIMARATAGGREISQRATAIAPVPNAERAFQSGFLTVFETAPFTVDALTLASSMDQLQTATLEVFVNRRPGFNGEVKLSAVGFSAGREAITRSFDVKEVTLKTNETTGKIPLVAKVDSEVATRPVLVRAEATDAGEKVVQFSQPMAVTIAQIPFVLSAAPAKLTLNAPRAGSTNVDEVLLKVKADRRGFVGEIPLTIEGALAGVQIEGTNIPANAAEATVKFSATAKTGPLTNASLTIQGAAMHKDRLYRHKTAAVRLSVVPPAVEVASTNSAAVPKP